MTENKSKINGAAVLSTERIEDLLERAENGSGGGYVAGHSIVKLREELVSRLQKTPETTKPMSGDETLPLSFVPPTPPDPRNRRTETVSWVRPQKSVSK